ncbi:hypothetical protein FisN_10Lu402 [Fistulifera solaris]|uniref:Uncharacterized protein n=1 Tax=Fistulifera solaris TaxID=1519565 RepID=A0A1Z5JUI2_FISSO|nr:hypothetical protein FisN_10Lu402 [Fistulifera solaris]|eukprot:GAX17680.1 hypothetical protein FisN_10Lu402 [Fistulifera solaris]
MNQPNESPLLQIIPKEQLSQRQKALLPKKAFSLLYKLLREPDSLDDFDSNQKVAIWRENKTIFVWNWGNEISESYRGRHFCFTLKGFAEVDCAIYGEKDSAIAETFTYFGSLQHAPRTKTPLLRFCSDNERNFRFGALQAEQLAHILDSNPTRRIEISAPIDAEQARVLATRPYPLNLHFFGYGFAFRDRGTAFVEALEDRESAFGSLSIFCGREDDSMSNINLTRLLKLENVFEKLGICAPSEECVLHPFCAKVEVLDYRFYAWYMYPEFFNSLNIVAKDLTLKVLVRGYDVEWDDLLVSFLNRVAVLGHLERLSISLPFLSEENDLTEFMEFFDYSDMFPVVEALIRAIHGNPKLSSLDLADGDSYLQWGPHMKSIFKAVEKHPSLRTLAVQSYGNGDNAESDALIGVNDDFVKKHCFYPSWLERLLSRNRNIVVVDESGNKCTNGSTIDEAYALNGCYNGSVRLVNESTALRPLLVTSALTRSASTNYQHTALLLSHNVDTLCEILHAVDFEDALFAATIFLEANQRRTSKRKTRVQPARAAKRAA